MPLECIMRPPAPGTLPTALCCAAPLPALLRRLLRRFWLAVAFTDGAGSALLLIAAAAAADAERL